MDSVVFDAHCDTISGIFDHRQNLDQNTLHLDLRRMPQRYIQVFAAFVDKENCGKSPLHHVLNLVQRYHSEIEKNKGGIAHCTDTAQITRALRTGKRAAMLSVEGGEALEGDLAALWTFYRLGVRMMTLTWNYSNEIGDGAMTETKGGLTSFGKTVVREMNRMGMAIDVSHLSEKGFWDVLELTSTPIVASHSNAAAVCGHPRNLSDRQIHAVIRNGGCIGLNFYPLFLCEDGKASVDDILRHLEHFLSLGAENNIGFGSDFDGIESLPVGIAGIEDMICLIDRLEQAGYPQNLIEKLAYKNFLHVLEEIL